MRRYHHSPSIPFLIARVDGVQKPIRSSLSGLGTSGATIEASDRQNASEGLFSGLRVFLWSLWVAGLAIGGGLALELNGMLHQGLWTQAFGFFVAGTAIIFKQEGE